MIKYIKRRIILIYLLPGVTRHLRILWSTEGTPVFYNTSKNRTSVELTDLLYNEMSHLLIL